MKVTRLKYQIIWLALQVSVLCIPRLALANDYYLNHTTSPQVTDMFRYGNVETSLFTGKLNLAIPIYQLEDPDFELNIALRYNSEGFKPKKHSGYIGYNWFLEAGGCITREVRNIPDEHQREYKTSHYKVKGMLPFTLSDKVDKDSIFMLHDDVVSECGTLSLNLDPTCTYDIDYLPDIFHFNFCGYHGQFMINNLGEVVIINGDYVTVDLSDFCDYGPVTAAEQLATPNMFSRITIKTTDGYTFVFGGDQSSVEYTLTIEDNQIPKQYPPSISTWHLKKIIAPNQREISFYYKDIETKNYNSPDPIWIFNEYYDYFKETDYIKRVTQPNIGQNVTMPDVNKMSQNISKQCIIDSIVVFGQSNVHISFHSSIDPVKFYNHNHYPLCKNNYMLDSICVRTDDRILTNARLTSIYKSFLHSNGLGYSWRFLSAVNIDGTGKYLLEYNHPTNYPDIQTIGAEYHNKVDFYGYCKSNVLSGTLKKITYPTGGYQIFTFEDNHCGIERRYSTLDSTNVKMSSIDTNNNSISGIRIARIDTYNNDELIERKTYTYTQKNTNKSSGIYYNQAQIYFASDPTKSFLTNSNGCYSLLDSHVGYSYVEEKTKNMATGEEYKVGYTFSTGRSSFNSSTDLTINRIAKEQAHLLSISNTQYILSGMLNYDSKLDGNGRLLLTEYYKDNTPTQTIQFEYNGIDNLTTELIPQSPSALGCTDTIVVFSHYFAPIARKLFVYPNVLTQKIVKDYGLDGQFLMNSTSYTYDSKFRIKKETTTNSDGSTYFTKYSYIDDLSFSNTDLSSNPYAFLISQNKIDKPIEVVSGYIQDNLEYITKGQVDLYNVEMRMKSKNNTSLSRIAFDPTLPPVSDSLDINNYVWYPSLHRTLNLHVHSGVLDYSPIVGRGDSIVYDNRYKLACEYSFDQLYRPEKVTPIDGPQITYTWDGFYPKSQTIGNSTITYTHIPYIGLSSTIDERGTHKGFSYDTIGRLIEIYQMHNNQKEILSAYAYRIKSDPETDESSNSIVTMIPSTQTNNISFNFNSMSASGSNVNTTINHYDGLGRPYQSIALGQSPTGRDIASLIEYTGLSRSTKYWLPISLDTDGQPLENSSFISQATSSYNDSRPYKEVLYESSALNRLIGTIQPGIEYAKHPTSNEYDINTEYDQVQVFKVSHSNSSADEMQLIYEGITYDPCSLYKITNSDEDGHAITTFKDKLGRVVLERQNGNDTYYVYDLKGMLCYVLPPLAAKQISTGVHGDDVAVLKKYAYVYKYDERGNQIYKRLPGCEPTLMVYDKSNALVLSQTGNQRARGTYWTVYKYDSLRRLIYTGEVLTGSNDHEGQINDFSQWLVTERFSTDEQLHPMSNTGYSRSYYDSHPMKLLTVNYYDDYQFLSFIADTMQSRMAFEAFSDNSGIANATGLLTGTRTYYLDKTGNYSETVYYYDYRGREIQRRTTNHLGGIDVLSTKYDFANNVTDTWSSQSTNNGLTTTEHYHYEYDHANRPLTTTYTFNNESPIVLQSYHYDELGRVHSRQIHGGIDSVVFAYDIRNQVTQLKSSGYEQDYYYNLSCPNAGDYSGGLYNGNISATTWSYGNQINGYTYTYDNMNRLSSTYSILNNSLNVDYLYSEKFTYDPHGNITSLERWDDNDAMDALGFTYVGNQLQSIDDRGAETFHYDAKHYHDNSNSTNDFAYDANGNMIYDQDRGIAAIRYNLLNLPDTIQFTNGNLIIHRYDAAGNRLETKYLTKKIAATVPLEEVVETPVHPQFFYITRDAFHNNIVYTANNTDAYGIEFVHNPEGYIRYYGPEEHYHFYYIKDLLGNIRETYVHPEAGYKECIQRMQYYPSGLPWVESAGVSEQPWKYNGKEFVEMHGLDEYDSKARWYYPANCRTTTMDPLAEKYYSTSPYAWCGNNPVRFVDPDGMDTLIFNVHGLYEKTIVADGDDIGVILNQDGTYFKTFSFLVVTDPKEFIYGDPRYYGVRVVTDEEIQNIIDSTKVLLFSEEGNFLEKCLYAYNQSRGGELDFVNTTQYLYVVDHLLAMPIIEYNGSLVAQNPHNFGNFLWGIAMRAMNIPYMVAVLGAHADAWLHKDIKTGKRKFDSKDDQLSIRMGYYYKKNNK